MSSYDPTNYEGQDRLSHMEKYIAANTAAVARLNGGSVPLVVSGIVRNGYGEISSLTVGSTTLTTTRNAFGVIQTVSDGTTTRTISRDGFGVLTGIA